MINKQSLEAVFEEEFLDYIGIKSLTEVYDFPFDELGEGDPSWEAPDGPPPEEEAPQEQPQEPPKPDITYKVNFHRGVLWSDYEKKLLKEFMPFVKKALKIEKDVLEIYLLGKRKGDMTTGAFDVGDEKIFILAKNRHHADVFRSIAHEVFHLKQKEDKEIGQDAGEDIPDIGGKIENRANAVAGQVMKHFANKVGKKALYDIQGNERQYERLDEIGEKQ